MSIVRDVVLMRSNCIVVQRKWKWISNGPISATPSSLSVKQIATAMRITNTNKLCNHAQRARLKHVTAAALSLDVIAKFGGEHNAHKRIRTESNVSLVLLLNVMSRMCTRRVFIQTSPIQTTRVEWAKNSKCFLLHTSLLVDRCSVKGLTRGVHSLLFLLGIT
jgi:hypothetical protein